MAGPAGNFLNDLHHAASGREACDFLVPAGPVPADQGGGNDASPGPVPASTGPTRPAAAGAAPVSYGEVFARAARFARVLADAGAVAGERVLVCVNKSVDAVAAYLACLHSGTVHVPLNPAFTDDELAYFVADAEPAVAVVDPARAHAIRSLGRPVEVLTLAADGSGSLVDLADSTEPLTMAQRAGSDLAALLYTSGTTGRPKGAALTHDSLRLNCAALHSAWRFGPSDLLVHSLPLFHVHGLFVALHCAMASAIPVIFLPRFDPAVVAAALHKATVFMGVPTHYRRLLDTPCFGRGACAGMRLFTSGSAPLPDPLLAEFAERSGHAICERYGMSETMILTSNPYEGDRLAGTVGFAVDGVELRVSDAFGAELGPGETGIVEVRSAQIMRGYWRRTEATSQAFRDDGWFVTGDLGSLDRQGRLRLAGRESDLIISGGENVYPAEVEAVLDAVDGVAESAVFGVPDGDLGEAVTAVLVAEAGEPSEQAVLDALDARLARFKHPKRIVWVDELSRNAMGKVQKGVLRERYGSPAGSG